jgi:adenosylcobinamide-GDP ribazoletransferase
VTVESAAGGGNLGVRDLLVACRYLTVLPLPSSRAAGDLGRAAGWFPLVGAILGGILAVWDVALDRLVPPLLGSVAVIGLWAFLTGGLHLDGLADAADGLGGGFGRDEALAIMRDARIGAYGVTAIALVLGLKTAALAGLRPDLGWRAVGVAAVLGRLGPLLLARLCPPARGDGAGHAFTLGVGNGGLALGGLIALVVALGALGPWGAVPVGATVAVAAGFAAYLSRRLGGLTGDCLGALVETTEALCLVAVAALAHRGLI